jgi:hypothetical protein
MAIIDTTARAWKATREAQAGVFIDEKRSLLVGDSQHFVAADRNGVTIKGPVSMVTGSEEIRTGGLFVGMNDFQQMIPSTIVTPKPMKLPIPPISGIANIVQDVAFFAALLV